MASEATREAIGVECLTIGALLGTARCGNLAIGIIHIGSVGLSPPDGIISAITGEGMALDLAIHEIRIVENPCCPMVV